MSLEKDVAEKLMEEGGDRRVESSGDKYDELNNMELSDHKDAAYAGMGKEELMKFANSPFWVRIRWLLFATFWMAWFAMMFGALFIIFMTPKCSPTTKLEWYKKSPVYVINAASLMSQGGLNEKIEYMKKLGIENVVLSSVYKTDKGEVIDFMKVNASLGNENTMKDLITKLKTGGMKVMLKLVPNHSSTSNLMFERSVLNESLFRDYYVWNPGFSDGVHHFPINNWLSLTGESAWKWNDNRKEFYLHQFSEEEADFNFRNKYVVDYFEQVFKFWLETGVDGLYLDKVQYLFEDKNFNNDTITSTQTVANNYSHYSHKATSNLPETNDLLSNWGKLLGNYSRILIVSDIDTKDISEVKMVHSSVTLQSDFTGEQLLHAILSKTTTPSWPSWEWVCIDKSNCWKNEIIDAFSILGSLLPGTPFINADPKLFENNQIPNITLIESTLKELRLMPTIEFGSFNAKLLNNYTVFAFDRVMSGSESLLFAWNLGKNVTVVNLNSFDGVPDEVNLSLCTQSACSILPPIKSKINSNTLNLAAESAVVLKF